MHTDLIPILKALLLSTSEPLAPRDLQKLFARYRDERAQELESDLPPAGAEADGVVAVSESGSEPVVLPEPVTATQVREALEALQQSLLETEEVYRLVEGPRGFQITCAPEYSDWIRLLRDEPRPLRLTPAAVETLTIIAYRQPVTRSDMEAIRGVSVDSALSKLLEHDLVQVLGRADLPGRPIQYGTTDDFLEFAGIKSLDELPASDIISAQRLDTWLREFNNQGEISDEDVGLPYDESTPVPQQESLDFETPESTNAANPS